MDAPTTLGLLYRDEVYRIQGAAFAVSNGMGPGFLESVYQECLSLEFARQQIPFTATPRLSLTYSGLPLKQTYSPDFVCYDAVIVELKAVGAIVPEHRAQILNYLKASGLKVGLLVNFGAGPKTQIERFAL